RAPAADHAFPRDDGAGYGDVARARGRLPQRAADSRERLALRGRQLVALFDSSSPPRRHESCMKRSEGDPRATSARLGGGMAVSEETGTRTAWMDVAATSYAPLGGGMTQRTTAHLSNAIDDRYLRIERLHGREGARLAAESHTAAIDRIEAIVRDERIDCDFERLDGYLVAAPGTPTDFLGRELAAAQRAGLADVTASARAPSGEFEAGECLRFPRQGQLHPGKYLAGLAHALEDLGGRIFCGTHADAVQGGAAAKVTTTGGLTVSAAAVVVAT